MGFYDDARQKAEAQMNVGREQLKMARAKRVGSLPQRLSNAEVLKLSKSGIKQLMQGTMSKNKAIREAQSTDANQ